MKIGYTALGTLIGAAFMFSIIAFGGNFVPQSTAELSEANAVRTATANAITAERVAGCVFRGQVALAGDPAAAEELSKIKEDYLRREHVKVQLWANQPWLKGDLDSSAALECATKLREIG